MGKDGNTLYFVFRAIGFILLFVAFYLVLTRVDLFLKYKAMDDCAKISVYESTGEGAKTSYPIPDVYNQCLKQKGL